MQQSMHSIEVQWFRKQRDLWFRPPWMPPPCHQPSENQSHPQGCATLTDVSPLSCATPPPLKHHRLNMPRPLTDGVHGGGGAGKYLGLWGQISDLKFKRRKRCLHSLKLILGERRFPTAGSVNEKKILLQLLILIKSQTTFRTAYPCWVEADFFHLSISVSNGG